MMDAFTKRYAEMVAEISGKTKKLATEQKDTEEEKFKEGLDVSSVFYEVTGVDFDMSTEEDDVEIPELGKNYIVEIDATDADDTEEAVRDLIEDAIGAAVGGWSINGCGGIELISKEDAEEKKSDPSYTFVPKA